MIIEIRNKEILEALIDLWDIDIEPEWAEPTHMRIDFLDRDIALYHEEVFLGSFMLTKIRKGKFEYFLNKRIKLA